METLILYILNVLKELTGMPVEKQRLEYNKLILSNESTMNDYSIKSESIIWMIVEKGIAHILSKTSLQPTSNLYTYLTLYLWYFGNNW